MIPKKKINEVKIKLQREPSIREIYVEGVFDRDLYRWVLKQLGLNDIRVYPINVVDVSDDFL
jgi:hypothetical protein